MKRLLILLMAAAMLTGCMASPVQPAQEARTAQSPTETTAETKPDPTLAMLAAYEKALEEFYTDHKTPDGEALWMEGDMFGTMDENSFAVADVDGDGDQELVIVFGTAPMAGMCAWVYGYDAEKGSLYQELSIFPGQTFYSGGLLTADWSHNQGIAGDVLWPYTLMKYDPIERTYQVLAQVDAWDKSLHDTDYDGNPFPEEVDTDNSGAVYFITTQSPDGQWETDTVSRSVYEAWRAGILGDEKPIEVEYLNTTLDNIHAVSPE